MKHFLLSAMLFSLLACSSDKLNPDGLKSAIEAKTGVVFKFENRSDSTSAFTYVLKDEDLAKGLGRFDSAKAGCIAYFKQPGTMEFIMDKAVFRWDTMDFHAILVSDQDGDSNIVFNVLTSVRPFVLNQPQPFTNN